MAAAKGRDKCRAIKNDVSKYVGALREENPRAEINKCRSMCPIGLVGNLME